MFVQTSDHSAAGSIEASHCAVNELSHLMNNMTRSKIHCVTAIIVLALAAGLWWRTRVSDQQNVSGNERGNSSNMLSVSSGIGNGSIHSVCLRRRPVRCFESFLQRITPMKDFDSVEGAYHTGWVKTQEARQVAKSEAREDCYKALILRREAYAYFLGIQKLDTAWKPEMVAARLDITRMELQASYQAFYKNMN